MERKDRSHCIIPETKCFLCGANLSYLLTHYDSIYMTTDKEYDIYKCESCGLLKMLPEPTAEEIITFYPDAYYSFNILHNASFAEKLLDKLKSEVLNLRHDVKEESRAFRFLAHFAYNSIHGVPLHCPRHNGRFLDIGCGDGYWVRKLAQYGWDCMGVEIAGEESNNIKVGDFLEMDFDDSFEFIRLSHVLEHVHEPEKYLAKIERLLHKKGELHIGIPNTDSAYFRVFGRYWYGLEVPRHLFGFNESNIRILLERNGLKIKRVQYMSRLGFGYSLKNYLSIKTNLDIRGQMLIGIAFSPVDLLMKLIGSSDGINVIAVHI